MENVKLKKLQLITVSLFILTILIMIIGLLLIGLFKGKEIVVTKNYSSNKDTKPLIFIYIMVLNYEVNIVDITY